ncbi:hypothetical protein lbkm_3875 [Lachnospiraceae bacterium KM106-2]|nr:hypothetical protein lbkm_3875 [Lachnospiraceae bacterium KM106-2]
MAARRYSILSTIFLFLLTIILGLILVLALYTIFDSQQGEIPFEKDYITYKGAVYKNVLDDERIQSYGSNPKASIGEYLGKAEEKNIYTSNIVSNQSLLIVETRSGGYQYYEFVKMKGADDIDGNQICKLYHISKESDIDRILVSKRDNTYEKKLSEIEKKNFSEKILGYAGIANYLDAGKKISGTKLWNIRDQRLFKIFIKQLKASKNIDQEDYKSSLKEADNKAYDFVVLLKNGFYMKGTYTPSVGGLSCLGQYMLTSKQNGQMKSVFKKS